MIKMELSRLLGCQHSEMQGVLLKEVEGNHTLPMRIGLAQWFFLRWGNTLEAQGKPLIYNTFVQSLAAADVPLARVRIETCVEGYFDAFIDLANDASVHCSADDAVAVASAANLPILVAESVIRRYSPEAREEEQQQEVRTWLDGLKPSDFGLPQPSTSQRATEEGDSA